MYLAGLRERGGDFLHAGSGPADTHPGWHSPDCPCGPDAA
jgi:hypothetical protein